MSRPSRVRDAEAGPFSVTVWMRDAKTPFCTTGLSESCATCEDTNITHNPKVELESFATVRSSSASDPGFDLGRQESPGPELDTYSSHPARHERRPKRCHGLLLCVVGDTRPCPSTCVDGWRVCGYCGLVDIEASARKHGVPDEDMLHALRHHWRAYETEDPAVTLFLGPSTTAEPLEVGVVTDDEGAAIIHAMMAREKFLKGWWIK